jgi:CRP/FNR family transcriptional regulator, cyclic AMP receptor protein
MPNLPLTFDLLARFGATSRSFDAGEKIFLEDDTGAAMFLVRTGRVDVITYGTVLENIRPGGIFGEMALIDDGPRSAAAIAAEVSDVVTIDKATFLALIREQPEFALHVMRLLTARLRKMKQHL